MLTFNEKMKLAEVKSEQSKYKNLRTPEKMRQLLKQII